MIMTLQKLFLTFFGSGLSPQKPDIVASIAALLFGIVIMHYLGMETLFMFTLAVTLIGIFEINKFMNLSEKETHTEIVIDKAAGVWLSLMITSSTAATFASNNMNLFAMALSLFAFILFDRWKPSTIGWIDREVKGGLGIMMASILSGIAGGLLGTVILMGYGKLL
jgi:phosphatidylglycerophosphatase A